MKIVLSLYSICLFVLLIGFSTTAFTQSNWQSKYVVQKKDGSLNYTADDKGNTIPDFSLVGYYHGKRNIPFVKVVTTLEPSGINSEKDIQAAIDNVAKLPLDKNGFRGKILLKKGIYPIAGSIKITASGIIICGEGEATKLIATGKGKRSLLIASGFGNSKEIENTRKKIEDKYVPVGAKSFAVTNTTNLNIGDKIIVFRPGTEKWIKDLKMNEIEERDGTKQWQAKEFNFLFEREITAIKGNTIFIDNPIVMNIEDEYGGGEIYKYHFDGRINNIGVENLSCESEYNGNEDEDHGWAAVEFDKIENGWIKNITAIFFGSSCVTLGYHAKNITVDSCKCVDAKSQITGGRRYSFNNDGQQNLIMNCFASDGRHDYVTGARVCGPNVFYNCKAIKTHADIGPHHRWAMGTLYDNIITDGEINIQDRGNWGTGHGWSGVTQVVWNCEASKAAIQNPYISGKNYVIALKATKYEGRLNNRPITEWNNEKTSGLIPVSLYVAQRNAQQLK